MSTTNSSPQSNTLPIQQQLIPDYQLWWISNYEKQIKASRFNIISTPIWHEVIRHQLDSHFAPVDMNIKECLQQNISAVFNSVSADADHDVIDKTFVKLPKLFWELLKENEAYRQLSRQKLNTSEQAESVIKLYADIANGAFVDSLRVLAAIEELVTDKTLDQSRLGGAIESITSKRLIKEDRDYTPYANLVSKDMRNAVDHGGHVVRSNDYSLTFTENHTEKTIYKSFSEVNAELKYMLSGLSAFVQVILNIMRDLNIIWLPINSSNSEQELTAWYRLRLSTPEVLCNLVEIKRLADSRLQFLVNLSGFDNVENAKLCYCLWSAIYAFQNVLPAPPPMDRLFITYESPRANNTFVAVSGTAVSQYISNSITFDELLTDATKDAIMTWPTNTDPTPIQQIDYQDIITNDYIITNIDNPNTETDIRFVADVEMARVTRPNHVKLLVPSIISVMRSLPSGGDMKTLTKHGQMPADIIFLRVFHDLEGKKGVSPDNDNFIATIQFDVNRKFPIYHNLGLLTFRKIRTETDIEYGWNPSFG
ncbi:hypothetical protein [Lacticaseibacillus hegangensis]|uniref:Apea-like HEPN domain-containing protein n=1 Tax=Lacticaseibacillus hegangensis TaxID=2486010 RepID=A0ABW4CW79_9LACO|nr:hypothetical protein [Lacticaseibacillus hegangensis]